MTAKQDRIIAKLNKQLDGLMAKSQTEQVSTKDEAGAYVNLVESPADSNNWRGTSLAIGVSKNGKIRLHTNKSKGGACVVADNIAEFESVMKEAVKQAKKLTETFVPIPKKE